MDREKGSLSWREITVTSIVPEAQVARFECGETAIVLDGEAPDECQEHDCGADFEEMVTDG